MDIAWNDLQLFLAIAETGSLSRAARLLKVGQPTVSRRLADLEYALGDPLFRRGVGGAVLTSAGERLLEPARKMAEWAGEAGRAALKADRVPQGTVRVTAPPGVAFDFVALFAAWLQAKQPRLRLEVLTSMNYLDLGRGEADLALRLKAPTQADLTVVATVEQHNAVFVSKSYAATLPKRPKFADLRWLAWAPPLDHLPPNPQLEAAIPEFKPAFSSDSFLVLMRAAEAGLGAIVLGRIKHRHSRPTTLVPLAIDLGPNSSSAMHLVCAKSALAIPRVRAVAELLADEMKQMTRF